MAAMGRKRTLPCWSPVVLPGSLQHELGAFEQLVAIAQTFPHLAVRDFQPFEFGRVARHVALEIRAAQWTAHVRHVPLGVSAALWEN